ncbi:DUF808 domain-containing protein [Thalassotalea ponticola]|uniref:DUF808 domain-containing protein n=1 Tax=Thalassotalea ponticola TaxID=1523392 RepID=UPI0025B5CD1F|nr:DUF808 domain-containing protein [Thalassotalea ponticola]MDN3653887.1 DUF808 domain-containing protein [Thalassotalea ponticola]
MAGTSLLALIDKIAAALDDVAVLTKVAAKKTAGVLGDDLALNAQQVTGVSADRELPVVWAVAKGSFINKLILVPSALVISSVAPWLITPLLILGGLFLCFEGVEKIVHSFFEDKEQSEQQHQQDIQALVDESVDMVEYERDKIKGAIKTDFILSAEIIVITLGTVQGKTLVEQASVVSLIALLMTIGVYGLVAAIVKLDDAGLHLSQVSDHARFAKFKQNLGRRLLSFAPKLMKGLAIVGTAAMFLVGGGIIVHGIPAIHHGLEWLLAQINGLSWLVSPLYNAIIGIIAGAIVLSVVKVIQKITNKPVDA